MNIPFILIIRNRPHQPWPANIHVRKYLREEVAPKKIIGLTLIIYETETFWPFPLVESIRRRKFPSHERLSQNMHKQQPDGSRSSQNFSSVFVLNLLADHWKFDTPTSLKNDATNEFIHSWYTCVRSRDTTSPVLWIPFVRPVEILLTIQIWSNFEKLIIRILQYTEQQSSKIVL